MDTSDIAALTDAKGLLEHPGIAAKITHALGTPFERGLEQLPVAWSNRIGEITKRSLLKVANAAIFTLKDTPEAPSSNWLHKAAVITSGGAGGFFGLPGLALELPVSTTIILRSICDIARSESENLHDAATKLACLEVFALGGRSAEDDAAESGYFAVRLALARSVTHSFNTIAERGLIDEAAPALLRLIAHIANRFGIQVTEKMAAQAIPLIGAAGGALINLIFIDHFQAMARGHFIVRRLERKYGREVVENVYRNLKTG
jgi:hypothetical protein